MGHKSAHQLRALAKFALAGVCSAAIAACGPQQRSAPASDNGKDGPAIISLNPCLDAILIEIAEPDQILALSHYSRDPSSTSIKPDVAAQFDVTGGTAEEILALNPDLVVASSFIPAATKAALERLDIPVETFGSPASLDESLAQIKRLAALAQRESKGRALNADIMRAVPVFGGDTPADENRVDVLLWQSGQIVPGEATLVWEHLARFGLRNHASAMGLAQADHVSLEAILANPPDLLLVAGGSSGQTHPLLAELKDTRIARFDPQLFYCGGPSMPKAWERLEQIRLDFMLNPPGSAAHDDRRHAH